MTALYEVTAHYATWAGDIMGQLEELEVESI